VLQNIIMQCCAAVAADIINLYTEKFLPHELLTPNRKNLACAFSAGPRALRGGWVRKIPHAQRRSHYL